jgi:hypothetical protein
MSHFALPLILLSLAAAVGWVVLEAKRTSDHFMDDCDTFVVWAPKGLPVDTYAPTLEDDPMSISAELNVTAITTDHREAPPGRSGKVTCQIEAEPTVATSVVG